MISVCHLSPERGVEEFPPEGSDTRKFVGFRSPRRRGWGDTGAPRCRYAQAVSRDTGASLPVRLVLSTGTRTGDSPRRLVGRLQLQESFETRTTHCQCSNAPVYPDNPKQSCQPNEYPPATSNGQCSNSLIRDHDVRTINKSIVAAIHVAVRGFA